MPEAIPQKLNLVISAGAITCVCTCLWFAAHATTWWGVVAAAVVFSFANHTLYMLMHEAVHGVYHGTRVVNEVAGAVLASFFPHAFCLQRAFHLSHHRYNRTDREYFDGYHPQDSLFFKRWQWYGILVGEYWLRIPIACVLWLLCPWALRASLMRDGTKQGPRSFGGMDMLWSLERMPPVRSRLDVLLMLAIQASLWYWLDLSVLAYAACYVAFALNWGSLQYTGHAWSERDVRNGAWNLHANPVLQAVLLNYHFHLVHHQQPSLPWKYLPHHADALQERPRFWRAYLAMWRGPRPAWGKSPTAETPQSGDPDMPFMRSGVETASAR